MAYALTGMTGKVALVTGAGRMRSIGRSISIELARAGCDVVLTGTGRVPSTYPEDERACGWRDVESVADEVRSYQTRALTATVDVSDEDQVEGLVDTVIEKWGRIDILINNAGAPRGDDRKPVVDTDPQAWRRVLDVNLNGYFLVARAVARRMIDAGRGGVIINISSIAGKYLPPNTAAYAASKAGVHALTACMAQETAAFGIRVNALCPGLVDTSRMDGVGRDREWADLIARTIPMGRAGTGKDVAGVALFLCSDQASWVTGQCWNVDGGQVVQH